MTSAIQRNDPKTKTCNKCNFQKGAFIKCLSSSYLLDAGTSYHIWIAMSRGHHGHRIFLQRFHRVQTRASSRDQTQADSDPQVNCWLEQQPLKILHWCGGHGPCTKVAHLGSQPSRNHCPDDARDHRHMAASKPSGSSSSLITSLIAPEPASNSSTSKMDAASISPQNRSLQTQQSKISHKIKKD